VVVVGRVVCSSSRRGRFTRLLRERAVMEGRIDLSSIVSNAWSALRQPPFGLKQRMRKNARSFNWLIAVCERRLIAKRCTMLTHTPRICSPINPRCLSFFFLQPRKAVLLAPSLLADVLDVWQYVVTLARLNPKHSFEPLHNS
jgi:hypothetical protein